MGSYAQFAAIHMHQAQERILYGQPGKSIYQVLRIEPLTSARFATVLLRRLHVYVVDVGLRVCESAGTEGDQQGVARSWKHKGAEFPHDPDQASPANIPASVIIQVLFLVIPVLCLVIPVLFLVISVPCMISAPAYFTV